MAFTYEYPRPSLTVDCIIFADGFKEDPDQLKVLLIRRGDDPFKGMWANPGGFVNVNDDENDQGEEIEDAARRELLEETGVQVDDMIQVGTFGAPKRDPRGRVITVAFMAVVNPDDVHVQAGDDAAEAKWFTLEEAAIMNLAFDHKKILMAAINKLMAMGAGPDSSDIAK